MEANDVKSFIDELVSIKNERDELRERVQYLEGEIAAISKERRDAMVTEMERLLWETKRSRILSVEDARYLRDVMVAQAPRFTGERGEEDE